MRFIGTSFCDVRGSGITQIILMLLTVWLNVMNIQATPPVAYDMESAKEICDQLPLESIEGIWLYPDDKVTVMILNDRENQDPNSLPTYIISVIDTSDARLHPGDVIGSLSATADEKTFRIELKTESKNNLLLKPKSVLASISKDGDVFTIKKQKAPFRERINLNFNRLLPGFWKIVSLGISRQNGTKIEAPVGMVKVYPSYDGNGSSKRKVRYL